MAALSKAWTILARSNAKIVGSNPTQCIDVCVRLFFVLYCVQVAASRRADPPSKEFYRPCKRSRKWKSGQGPTKGCKAIDRQIGR
jgi:hypothetical protein